MVILYGLTNFKARYFKFLIVKAHKIDLKSKMGLIHDWIGRMVHYHGCKNAQINGSGMRV